MYTRFRTLVDYCESELDFTVTLPLDREPARKSNGHLKFWDARDARLAIEIFNKMDQKVVQVRQNAGMDIDDMAKAAFIILETKGFLPNGLSETD